jgi:peptidoglycan/xylan/chitin deacetylase (PgdA/CDA1 family)
MSIATHTATRFLRRGARVLMRPFNRAAVDCLGVITAVRTSRPMVALTFDDGPDPESTPAVLAVLDKHGARATFFMIGELAEKNPKIVRAAAAAGHAIANHSWNHLSFPLLTARERYTQLRRCEQALEPYGQKLFRPPYCHQTLGSRWHTLRAGYEVIAFNVHAEDWLARSAEWMVGRLVQQIRPGSIVILHDNIYRSILPAAQFDRKPMLRALDESLERLQNRFQFVTVPELLQYGQPVRKSWYQQGPEELQPVLERQLIEQRSRLNVQGSRSEAEL